MANVPLAIVDHAIVIPCPNDSGYSGVLPVVMKGGKVLFSCANCASIWCDLPISSGSVSGTEFDRVVCGEPLDFRSARRALAQDVIELGGVEPQWHVAGGEGQDPLPPPHDFVVDHSGYVLSVGGCSVCDQDRVLAWVTVSGRLVFRCLDGHENTENFDGVEFPLWWVPGDEDASTRSERYANAGDIAAIIRASGPRSSDDQDLALFDVKWAILPRPEKVEA